MGYMGFGMQRWVYQQKPRRPFGKSGIPYTNTINIRPANPRLKFAPRSSKLYILISFFLIGFTMFMIVIKKPDFMELSKQKQIAIEQRKKVDNDRAFQFLMTSGKNRLSNNNIIGAYSEFKLAYNLDKTALETKELLIETLNILCVEEAKFCKELDDLVNLD